MAKKPRKQKNKFHPKRKPLFEMNPFPEAVREQLAYDLGERSAGSESRFEADFESLKADVWSFTPLNLLSVIAYYGTVHHEGKLPDPAVTNPVNIELVQALCLMKPPAESGAKMAVVKQGQELIARLNIVRDDFHRRRLGNPLDKGDKNFKKDFFIEFTRTITQGLRNWSTPQEIRDIASSLFGKIDNEFQQVHGVTATEVLSIFQSLNKLFLSRAEDFSLKRQRILRGRSIPKQVHNFCLEFPGLIEEKAWSDGLVEMNVPAKFKRVMLLSRADTELQPLFQHTPSEIASEVGLDEPKVVTILDRLSLKFGDLKSENPEFFFLSNPVWTKPLIKLDDGSYFLPCLNLLNSHLFEILEMLVAEDQKLKTKYEETRDDYLEEAAAEIFAELFPRGQVWSGSKFVLDNVPYENDIAVQVERTLFVVECKAGKIHDAARRGAMKQLKTDITEVILTPNTQAKRFAEFLMNDRKQHRLATKNRNKFNEIDTRQITKIIPLTVVFSPLGGIGLGTDSLRNSGLIPAGLNLQPVLSLADLRWLKVLLSTEMSRYDYLSQRAIIETEAAYLGDEMDLLALYLDKQFNHLMDGFFYGKSEDFNPFFHNISNDIDTAPPELNIEKKWAHILERVNRVKDGWSDAASILMRLDKPGQRECLKRLKKVRNKAWKEKGRVYYEVQGWDDIGLMCCSQYGLTPDKRTQHVTSIVAELREQHDFRHLIALCPDLDERGPQNRDFVDKMAVFLFLSLDEGERDLKIRT